MKADLLIPGNWYYHNDVLVQFIFKAETYSNGYRFERDIEKTFTAFSLDASQIEKEITHELKFIAPTVFGCGSCCLVLSLYECDAIGNCSTINRADKLEGHYIKSELK